MEIQNCEFYIVWYADAILVIHTKKMIIGSITTNEQNNRCCYMILD